MPDDSEFFRPNGLLGATSTPNPHLAGRSQPVAAQDNQPPALPAPSPVPQAPPRAQTPLPPTLSGPHLAPADTHAITDAADPEQDYVPSSSPPLSTPLDARVPSSATPSPMRIPKEKGKGKATEISREKTKEQIGVSSETARALQESLTSLLGRKRSVGSMEELVEGGGGAGESVGGGANGAGVGVGAGAVQGNVAGGRAGKRPRPRSIGARVCFLLPLYLPNMMLITLRYISVSTRLRKQPLRPRHLQPRQPCRPSPSPSPRRPF